MMMWIYGAVILALGALAAEMFARYRRIAVELELQERSARAKAEKHAEVAAKLRLEIPEIEAEIEKYKGERAALEKDLNWERENCSELTKRYELRHTGRQSVDRTEED